ncbi:FtsX-like permease family protein [Kribbella antibiotica]|uniref:FtsX-like permease family protein n=1 Tax=Kribbella antibiotica TaxID=190195 RepID=A0A4V2YL23_9ACTN|nr:FtsX-like permease family protein [Kribbella antibiotica]TDD45057.1 FtsX-like permease family protein [Kribbella antibiotica]
MRRSLLSSLRAHMGRLVAACLAIVLGVGFGALAMTAHSSASHGIDETIGAQYKGVDAYAYPNRAELKPTDVAKAKALPEVAEVVPKTTAYMEVAFPGVIRPDSIPIDALQNTTKIAVPSLAGGKLPTANDEIALPNKLAAKYKVVVGQSLRITSYDKKSFTVKVVGLIDDKSAFGQGAAVATLAAVKLFEPGGYIQALAVAGKDGMSQQAVADAVQKTLSADIEVYTGKAWIEHEIKNYTNGIDVLGGVFGMFAVIALFVACLVISNTFTIVIAQRTREMALLRCVGASKRQVFSSVLAEATVVGVIASAIGVVFGIALSALALALSREFDWGIPPVSLHLDLSSIFLPLLLGTVATIVAAVVPARRATKVAPLAALRPESAPAAASKRGVLRLIFGFMLLGGGGALLAYGAGQQNVPVGVGGGVISFLGMLAVGTLLVPALIKVLGALPARTGVPARIAVANAVRNPKRTAATTAALLIGVTLISMTCVGIASVRKTFDVSMDGQYPVDLTVATYNEKLPAGAEQQLKAIKGITAVVPIKTVTIKTKGEEYQVTGIDQATAGSVIHNPGLADSLKPGTALVDYGTLHRLGLKEGAKVTIVSGKNSLPVTLKIGLGLEPFNLTATDLAKLAPNAPTTGYWLASDPKADGAEVIDSVSQSLPSVKELSVSGGLAKRTAYTKIFDVLLAVGIGLLGVSVLIALVGVGNTLSLSVLERTRENALLRAMGLTRRQLRSMLAIESLLMALVAAGLGIALGLIYGWAGTSALMGGQTKDGSVEYAVPVGLLVTIAAIAAVAGLLASVLPARRAAKVAPAGALATE